jgi:inhibitor of cysteine peptidase
MEKGASFARAAHKKTMAGPDGYSHRQFPFALPKEAMMFTRLRLAALMLMALLGLTASAAYDGKTVTVTEKDNGGTVTLAKGDTLVVRMEGSAGTGYSWTVAKNDKSVLAVQSQSTERQDKKPGGKVTAVIQFSTPGAGTSDLELNYARPFDKDKAPAKTFKLKVKVE